MLAVIVGYVVVQVGLAPVAYGAIGPAEGEGAVVWGVFLFVVGLWAAVPVAMVYFWVHRPFLEADADGVRFRVFGRALRIRWANISEIRVASDPSGNVLGVELGGLPGASRTIVVPMKSFDVSAEAVIGVLAGAAEGRVDIRRIGIS
ncbi:hypothetical protein [Actinocorallia lasiicapitis]